MLHSATGKYDDADLSAKPAFYGNTEYGRMNMKVVTAPDLSNSEWQLVYLPSLVTKDLAIFMANAALKNSIADHGERPSGPVALSCKDDMLTTTCTARRQACK